MLTKNTKLFYPAARDWMWTYCIYLGHYTDSKGKNYDLGIYVDYYIGDREITSAIVYGNEPGQYMSGNLEKFGSTNEIYAETIKRAKKEKLF